MKTSNVIRRGAAALVVGGAAVAGMSAPAQAVDGATWDALAQCESGGNWGINTGNGFGGGLQFVPSTWAAYGGTGSAQNASRAEQIRVAENVLAGQGWGAWPACSASLGLYGKAGAGTAVAPQAAPVYQAPVYQAPAAPAYQAPVYQAPAAAPVQQAPVYQAPAVAPVQQAVAPAAPVQAPTAVGVSYTVVPGDTLGTIAARYGVDWKSVYAANQSIIANPDLIFPGQVFQIPA